VRMLVVGPDNGGYFGGRLARQAGTLRFWFALRVRRNLPNAPASSQPHGDFTLRPTIVTADRISGAYDAILLTVKAFSLDSPWWTWLRP